MINPPLPPTHSNSKYQTPEHKFLMLFHQYRYTHCNNINIIPEYETRISPHLPARHVPLYPVIVLQGELGKFTTLNRDMSAYSG